MPISEIRARNYAWRQSLEKGAKLCLQNGHKGDAETLQDIVKHLEATAKAEAESKAVSA